MSYQNGSQGYGSYNPYGQSGNPYGQSGQSGTSHSQSGNPFADQGSPYSGNQSPRNQAYGNTSSNQPYGQQRPQPTQQGSSYYGDPEQGQSGYSQTQHVPSQPQQGYSQSQPARTQASAQQPQASYELSNISNNSNNRILNETRDLNNAMDSLQKDLSQLKVLQQRYVNRTDLSSREEDSLHQELQQRSTDIFDKHVALTARINKLKQDPESGNPRNSNQVGKVSRRMQSIIKEFNQQDLEYRRNLDETLARQYRTVNPEATDAEIREALQDGGNTQIFTQALMNSDRRGQAQRVADEVRTRNAEIRKIEETILGLNRLFQDLETAIIQQEPAVTQIEEQGEAAKEHVGKANEELNSAVGKAKAARRKKWWCFGIAVLIVIIIIIVVVVLVELLKKN